MRLPAPCLSCGHPSRSPRERWPKCVRCYLIELRWDVRSRRWGVPGRDFAPDPGKDGPRLLAEMAHFRALVFKTYPPKVRP